MLCFEPNCCVQTVSIVNFILSECLCLISWHHQLNCLIQEPPYVQYLLPAAQLLTLMLVACLEGMPVALAAPTPGIVAQGAEEDGLPAQNHRHALYQLHLSQLCQQHMHSKSKVTGCLWAMAYGRSSRLPP